MWDTTEDKVLAWIKIHDRWEARTAHQWVESFGTIMSAYAEFTGGHIPLKTLHKVLSEECFKCPAP